jgi:DNA sulfur modification protein DndD
MKLLRARFENFRLLRELDLKFSTDSERNLTVVRAENETGKTTILTAMQWAFYGDEALPGDAKSYRLHPIDWPEARAQITVEVDFETTSAAKAGRPAQTKKYRLVRTATEDITSTGWQRGESRPTLFELTPSGAQKLEYSENRVRTELPPELREVFFTDGDRALSFIEADSTSIKRQRVENAIKALLGLSIVEDAAKHVRQASADVNRSVKNTQANVKVQEAAKKIERLDEEIARLEDEATAATDERVRCVERVETLSKKIETVLANGDRAELAEELQRTKQQRKQNEVLELQLAREHGDLFKSKVLARQLLANQVGVAASLLDKLKERGDIPSQTIPVLGERLKIGLCICGEDLSEGDDDGRRRREHIEHMIEESRAADNTQKMMTELYYGARELMEPVGDEDWPSLYRAHVDKRQKVAQNLQALGAKEAQLEAKIALIPDVDIQSFREERKVAKQRGEEAGDRAIRAQTKLEAARLEKRAAEVERDAQLKVEDKGQRLAAELLAGQDILQVFERSLHRLKHAELKRVSELMNEIFLDMIGADADQGAIIRRAEISPEFDILVFGPEERRLNPDRDLNGASRRALTLAFILALTKVSEVEAPNIIDTPLGMMSGYVKSSVLQSAIRYSSQLILFLTRAEIAGTDRLLEKYAGEVVTLTNPAHYPRMLLHRPQTTERQVLSCECSYDEHCKVCERRMDVSALSELAGADA